MQDVHQRPFQTGDAYCDTRAFGSQHAEVLRPGAEKRLRKLGSPEDLRAERERPHRAGRGVDQVTRYTLSRYMRYMNYCIPLCCGADTWDSGQTQRAAHSSGPGTVSDCKTLAVTLVRLDRRS